MINWKLAKQGATVKFKCGGCHEIEKMGKTHFYYVWFKGYEYVYAYGKNGNFEGRAGSPFDIVEIIPAPEPKRIEFFVNGYDEFLGGEWGSKEGAIGEATDSGSTIATFKITYTSDPENPSPTIEVVK